jgi:hypothetical protein
MAAQALSHSPPADPLDVLAVRARVRAYLVSSGDFDLHDAVDGLQAYAIESGLVDAVGQDRVQSILSEAFAAVAP